MSIEHLTTTTNISTPEIWSLLEQVPDPEVPVLSIIDLGIVREVKAAADEVEVTITPTYSGCPAIDAITVSIRLLLLEKGFKKINIKQVLSPAWTTDWMSEAGKQKLLAYGIAPPTPYSRFVMYNCLPKTKPLPVPCAVPSIPAASASLVPPPVKHFISAMIARNPSTILNAIKNIPIFILQSINMPSILFQIDNNVAIITLNRPDKLNAFNREMALLLQQKLDECASLQEVRCVYMTGAGKGFSAGQDLAEIVATDGPTMTQILSEHYNPIIDRIRKMAKPVIAAVNGVAAGAGANIALCCDIVVAAQSASFIQAFSKLGLIPDSGGTFSCLASSVGKKHPPLLCWAIK